MPIEFTEEWYQNLPVLSEKHATQLFQIRPSNEFYKDWYPCSVSLKNREIIKRVYIVDGEEKREGGWIEDSRPLYSLEDVIEIKESPYRLPNRIWIKLNEAGESGMAYHVFTLKFSDDTLYPYLTTEHLDFLDMPEGKTEADISDVIPHHPRETDEQRWHEAEFGYIYYRSNG